MAVGVIQSPQGADDTLVAAALGGSHQAFSLLVERHHGPLLNHVRRKLGDPDLAADITQQTFLDAFRNLHRLPALGAFAPWLYRIARNYLLMEWRRRRRQHLVSLERLTLRLSAAPPPLRHPEGAAACAERLLIQQVLGGLSPCLSEALLLQGLLGFTSQEIAQRLGISSEAARKRVGRAKAQFRQRYRALDERGHP